MKVTAMRVALINSHYPAELVDLAIDAFLNNFGKSRQYNCQYFVTILLGLHGKRSTDLQKLILAHYSQAVEDEYLNVAMTSGSLALLKSLKNKSLYISSGSEEKQLIRIFNTRTLNHYFKGIFGSPETKSNNVNTIIQQHPGSSILFIGDAVADYNAAMDNKIDYIFYSHYSNVKDKMLAMSKTHHFKVINSF